MSSEELEEHEILDFFRKHHLLLFIKTFPKTPAKGYLLHFKKMEALS